MIPPPIVAGSNPNPGKPPSSAKKIWIGTGAAVGAGAIAVGLSKGGSSESQPVTQRPDPTTPTPTPTVTPTPRPEPTVTTPTPRPTDPPTAPPPPPTCPNVFRAYTGRGVTVGAPCAGIAPIYSGTLQISGTCASAVFVVSDINQGTRTYRGTVAANGGFSGNGSGTILRFTYSGTIGEIVSGPAVSANETLNLSSGCRHVYQFNGS